MKIIPKKFYFTDTVTAAKNLLGKVIVRQIGDHKLSGIITEVEAYTSDDPASHSYRGKTARNKAMFGQVGHAYIYFTYGLHYCLNIVAKDAQTIAGGVLIRALKPVSGIDIMCKNRGINIISKLTDGPGKLTQALNINLDLYGIDVTKSGPLYIIDNNINFNKSDIIETPRIGIKSALDKKWRFVIKLD